MKSTLFITSIFRNALKIKGAQVYLVELHGVKLMKQQITGSTQISKSTSFATMNTLVIGMKLLKSLEKALLESYFAFSITNKKSL